MGQKPPSWARFDRVGQVPLMLSQDVDDADVRGEQSAYTLAEQSIRRQQSVINRFIAVQRQAIELGDKDVHSAVLPLDGLDVYYTQVQGLERMHYHISPESVAELKAPAATPLPPPEFILPRPTKHTVAMTRSGGLDLMIVGNGLQTTRYMQIGMRAGGPQIVDSGTHFATLPPPTDFIDPAFGSNSHNQELMDFYPFGPNGDFQVPNGSNFDPVKGTQIITNNDFSSHVKFTLDVYKGWSQDQYKQVIQQLPHVRFWYYYNPNPRDPPPLGRRGIVIEDIPNAGPAGTTFITQKITMYDANQTPTGTIAFPLYTYIFNDPYNFGFGGIDIAQYPSGAFLGLISTPVPPSDPSLLGQPPFNPNMTSYIVVAYADYPLIDAQYPVWNPPNSLFFPYHTATGLAPAPGHQYFYIKVFNWHGEELAKFPWDPGGTWYGSQILVPYDAQAPDGGTFTSHGQFGTQNAIEFGYNAYDGAPHQAIMIHSLDLVDVQVSDQQE